MLVIRRREGESLLLGEAIEIEVLEILGTRVKLGITAPASVIVERKEIKIVGDENVCAVRAVRHQDLSFLLKEGRCSRSAKAVKNLTGPSIFAPKST